jgi:hypothetical protein
LKENKLCLRRSSELFSPDIPLSTGSRSGLAYRPLPWQRSGLGCNDLAIHCLGHADNRQSLDFGPFLQEEPASLVWSEKTHNPSRRPSIPVHVVRGHWDFAAGSVARPQTAKRIQEIQYFR